MFKKLLLVVLSTLILSGSVGAEQREPLPTYGKLPDLDFTNQDGESSAIYKNSQKVLLLNFFFTSCQGICPNIMGKLARVQKQFASQDGLQMVSLSVDPDRDDIKALKQYEAKLKANLKKKNWQLGRLDQNKLLEFMRGGAKLAGDKDPNSHSTRVVLVDSQGFVRAYFNGLDPDLYDQIHPAVQQLLAD